MDPLQVARLKEEHQKGLQACEEKIAQWEKFKKDYETLQQRLETLPNALSYDITVPFGSNAFTKGKLVHTNEITVLLGDNWFAEVSAKQAEALANRRIKQCTNMLEDLEKEQKQFENWLNYIDEVSNKDDLVEIVEKYDEEQEKKWRERHAENLRAHRQKLAEEQRRTNASDEELHLQLDDLELNESTSDDGSQHLEMMAPPCENDRNNKEMESAEEEEEEEGKSPPSSLECGSPGSGKHVRWQDLSKQNVTKITFKHSKKIKNKHRFKQQGMSLRQDSSESEDQPLIQSPSDIYHQFGSFFPASPPKSILKVKNSPPSQDNPFFPPNNNRTTSESDDGYAFTGEVCERSEPLATVEKKNSRPSSHFKNSRKNRKR